MNPIINPPRWPVPATEATRLTELLAIDILDTPAEDPFDGMAEIAAALFESPFAGVTFIDSDRQWVKASVNIPFRSCDRAMAFCSHTIMSRETMIVEDFRLDVRFQNHPYVVGEPQLRSYIGAPLVTHRGEMIGTICVLDVKPRRYDHERVRLLERIAHGAIEVLESRRLLRQMALISAKPFAL